MKLNMKTVFSLILILVMCKPASAAIFTCRSLAHDNPSLESPETISAFGEYGVNVIDGVNGLYVNLVGSSKPAANVIEWDKDFITQKLSDGFESHEYVSETGTFPIQIRVFVPTGDFPRTEVTISAVKDGKDFFAECWNLE
jgi:hypothetical protein